MEKDKQLVLAPLAVIALKEKTPGRVQMKRTIGQDMQEKRGCSKEAAEQSLTVILDLDLGGHIRWVSPSWQEVIGTDPDSVRGQRVTDLLVGDQTAFTECIKSIKKDGSRSRIIRFQTHIGPGSVLHPRRSGGNCEKRVPADKKDEEQEQILNLKAQGIMVCERGSGGESHTMWMIQPLVVREVTIDLPEILVETLGVGAEILAQYLAALAEVGANNPAHHPPALPVLCRICERQITPWWFEKHTELCLQEHQAEMEVQLTQESLNDHRNSTGKVLNALEAHSRQSRATSSGSTTVNPVPPKYKGLPISLTFTLFSGPSSGYASPASPPTRSRNQSTSFSDRPLRYFPVRRRVSGIIKQLLDLCNTALEINTSAIEDNHRQLNSKIRTQSPLSENCISQGLSLQSLSTGTLEQERGLSLLYEDTKRLAKAKVNAVFRHCRILEYSKRIRIECDVLIQECVDAAMSKAARITAGELGDSSKDEGEIEQTEGFQAASEPEPEAAPTQTKEGIFPASFEAPSEMAVTLRNASDASLPSHLERRASSIADSNRSSSPRGSQTPRSHACAISIVTASKRASMHFESGVGYDSDSGVRSSVISSTRRAESPWPELGLSRMTSTREPKRRSLILSFSTGQHHERRKTSSGSSPLSQQKSGSLAPGNFFEGPRFSVSGKVPWSASSPIKIAKTAGHERGLSTTATATAAVTDAATHRHSSGFKHQPLNLSKQQIRLLWMNPSPTLSCSIQHVDLCSRPRYKALSYTWGDTFPTREISINRQRFTVRENLYQFLDTIQIDRETLFWIDQICIDQSNVHERNHQVNFMTQIYHNASEVVIWLGPAANNSSKAMRLIAGAGEEEVLFKRSFRYRNLKRGEDEALNALFNRSYWYRVWILQEIMHARQIVVLCGDTSIIWSDLEKFFRVPQAIRTEQGTDRLSSVKYNGWKAARTIVNEKASHNGYIQRLSFVLTTFSEWQCGEVRDRIYGLLGLVPEYSRVVIDYSKPLEEIFFDVLRKTIEDENYIELESHLDFSRTMWLTLGCSYIDLPDVERFVRDEFQRAQELH